MHFQRSIFASLACAALVGCQGMYIHNGPRADTAATATKNVAAVDIGAIATAEQANLSRMLGHEVDALQARSNLVASLAVIQLSSGEQPLKDQYAIAIGKMTSTQGTSSTLALREAEVCRITRNKAIAQEADARDVLSLQGLVSVPSCKAAGTASFILPAGLAPGQAQALTGNVERYKKVCVEAYAKCGASSGELELQARRATIADNKARAQAQKALVAAARTAYEAAVAANTSKTTDAAGREKELRDKAQNLLDQLDKLSSVSSSAADRLKGEALVQWLGAIASGKPDGDDASQAAARQIAASLPTIAQSYEVAKAKSEQVPVSHLLLAMNDLLIAAQREERLAGLDAEDLALMEGTQAELEAQAGLWRTYNDQLCNVVMLAGGKGLPGQSCEVIAISGPANSGVYTCDLAFADKRTTAKIDTCVVGKSWRELVNGRITPVPKGSAPDAAQAAAARNETRARRALFEAAAAYLQLRLVAYETAEQDFRRIDVAQRRSLVMKQAALEQWKNLIAVPAAQLQSYYDGGVKPAELADLIVKALGLTALAIGVAK